MRRLEQFAPLNHITKRYEPAVINQYMLPYKLTFDQAEQVLPVTIPAAGTILKSMRAPQNTVAGTSPLGTPFEGQTLMFADSTDTTAAAAFSVMLKLFSGRNFSNQPIHVRTMFGTAQLPLELPEPIFLFATETLALELTKLGGGATTMRPYVDGVQYFPDIPSMDAHGFGRPMLARITKWMERLKYIFPYFLTTETTVSLGAGLTNSYEVKIDNSHFEALKIAVVSTGNFGFELQEVLTGEILMNGQVTQTNALGNALYPTILPFSYLLPQGSRVRMTFTDLSAAPNTIYPTIIGRKILAPLKDIPAIKQATDDILPPADQPSWLVEEQVGVA